MRKFLLLFVSLFMTMGMFAQTTVLWSEDFSTYEKDDVPTGGTYAYACANGGSATKIYAEAIAGGKSPELLVSKTNSKVKPSENGTFSATIPMQGISGEVKLQYKTNQTLNILINNVSVTPTKSGNDYLCVTTIEAGVENVTIVFSNSSSKNARLDDIKFYQGTAKKAPGLSWGTASRQVTLGAEDNSFPTLTNDNNLDVTYSSSNESVATINTTGEITLVAAGSTIITAAFAGNDEYEAGSVSYTLSVKAATSSSETNTPETAYTIAKALLLIADSENSTEKVYVKGKISKIDEVSTQYGNATYYISDDGTETNQLKVFRGYYLNNEKFTAADQINVGDEVIVYGVLINYNNTTPEINQYNNLYSHNGKTTGISEIAVDNAKTSPVYNTAGQRVDSAYKGIVIKNGKKVLVK